MDSKEEKKIKRDIEVINDFFYSISKKEYDKANECNEKKISKLKKKIEFEKRMITVYTRELSDLGANMEEIVSSFSQEQQEIMKELFPCGFGEEAVANQEKRTNLIKMWKGRVEKVKEAREKYEPYDAESPVKMKLKNKIYKRELDVGWLMLVESDKRQNYQEAWNYTRDFATSKDFTQEEREIIEYCIKQGKEYDAYLEEKFAPITNVGKSICKWAEEAREKTDKGQAQIWAKKLYKEYFPDVIKLIYPGKHFTTEEMENESKAMTIRYIQTMGNPEKLEELMRERKALAKENLDMISKEETFKELQGEERKKTEAAFLFELTKQRMGIEKAYFAFLYSLAEEQNNYEFETLLTSYSLEELGLE